MLNHPFACYRSRHQQLGPWHLRLVAWSLVALVIGAAYQVLFPMAVMAAIARQWL
jgi:hypothetical protein